MLPPDFFLHGAAASVDPSENDALLSQVFDYETVQLESGDYCRKLEFAATNRFICYSESVGARLHNLGTLRGDLFGIALTDVNHSSWWGNNVESYQLPTATSHTVLETSQESGLSQTVLLWSRSGFEHLTSNGGLNSQTRDQIASFWELSQSGTILTTQATDTVREWFHFFESQVHAVSSGQLNLSSERFEALGLGTLISIADETALAEHSLKISRSRALDLVCRAVEFDGSVLYAPCIIPVICGHLECSRRTLELAFREIVGLSPLKYLNRKRLNRLYKDLRSAHPAMTSVTELGAKHGFSELGRLSGSYKKIFGETPGTTLRSFQSNSGSILPHGFPDDSSHSFSV